jgi:hypothetical protein
MSNKQMDFDPSNISRNNFWRMVWAYAYDEYIDRQHFYNNSSNRSYKHDILHEIMHWCISQSKNCIAYLLTSLVTQPISFKYVKKIRCFINQSATNTSPAVHLRIKNKYVINYLIYQPINNDYVNGPLFH